MGEKSTGLHNAGKWILKQIYLVVDFIYSFLEMHLIKIVAFAIMCHCCLMVNALHLVIVVMLLSCLAFAISALEFSFFFIGPYLSILFLSKMAYQTKFILGYRKELICSKLNSSFHLIITNTILDTEWWGYEALTKDQSLITYYKSYVIVFAVMTLQTVIKTRQKIARIDNGLPPDVPNVIFLKITRADADQNLKNLLKFLINYGFYKFGIEVTMSYSVFVIGYREDFFSVVYATWIFIMILPKRKTLAIMWPFFLTTVLFSILWQYVMAVGLSKKTCFEYPWAGRETLIKWMFLPNFERKLNTKKTLGIYLFRLRHRRFLEISDIELLGIFAVDFVLLLLIKRQQDVFDLEKRFGDRYNGGSNSDDYNMYSDPDFINPTPDHTMGIRSCLDLAKLIFMTWCFRITLACLFWNGANTLNVLSLGYLIAAFVFLWIDYDLCLWPTKKILKWWNTLLVFTSSVILVKSILEFVGCIYGDYLKKEFEFIVGLFWVHCCIKKNSDEYSHAFDWDVVCFITLILQRRLQAKGAKLMDELQKLRLTEFQDRERRTLMEIKKNMNRIKAWQKRMQGLNYNEPKDHATAIYMGDYFMFEDFGSDKDKFSQGSSISDETDNNEEKEKDGKSSKPKDVNELEKDKSQESSTEKNKEEEEKGKGEKEEEDPEKQKRRGFRLVMIKFLVILINYFNKQSKDYRFIQSVIQRERMKQKARSASETQSATEFDSDAFPLIKNLETVEDERDYYSKPLKNLLEKTVIALARFCMSKTELFCYIIIFLHTILSPNLISLALPMMVFLWGSLTSIRPTATFWTVLIAYTEVMVVIKAIFQNSVFPWNGPEKKSNHYEYPPLFLGIHKDSKFVLADLFLLIQLFLHRYKLKKLGLWNRAHEETTFPPEDLKLYKEMSPEGDWKNFKAKRSLLLKGTDLSASVTAYLQTALWKCTSRCTAKYVYKNGKVRAKILVKEIEGAILVTHDGRRLQPTHIYISQTPEEYVEGNVILRVYTQDIVSETKSLAYRLTWIQHFTTLRKFFLQILVRDWRVSYDFYTFMFIFQFLNFLTIFFGYTSFANPDDLQSHDYFSLIENQVPPMYVVTIMVHFLVIVVDRVLYLRKSVVGKLIFQIILVNLVHIWMFIIIPIVTESSFHRVVVRQLYYFSSCLYFLMSAYQLRVGYPMRVQGHFLCKKYGYVNYYFYKGLQFLPFFNQLRTLLDYLCTRTSLSMVEWIKMESIFETVFENKCYRYADICHPTPRGEEWPRFSKYCPGILSFGALLVIIWSPFIIFAVFNSVAQSNLPQEATLEVNIGNFGNIHTSVASFNDIISFTDSQYTTLQKIYKNYKKLWTFLSLYDSRDVAVLKFRSDPFKSWSINPKKLSHLNKTVQNLDIPVTIYIVWVVQRSPRLQVVSTGRGHTKIVLRKGHKSRRQLAQAFLKEGNKVRLNNVLPKFIHVTNEGKASPLAGFLSPSNVSYVNVSLTLEEEGSYLWWKLEELAEYGNDNMFRDIPFQSKNETTIYTFNEKNTPKLLLNVRKKGIIGLYLSIVFVMWTFVRRIMTKYPKIMFEEMPNPDPVLQLCQDIYLARENHEFALEEDLYAKLLFLFRSPETMIKVTRLLSMQTRPVLTEATT